MRVFLLLCSLLWLVPSAYGVQRFVTNTATGCTFPASNYDPATNSCPGGSSPAYDTPQACADATGPGDSCEFRAGNFDQVMTGGAQIYLTISTSGTAGNPIIYRAYNNEVVNIRCQDATTPNNYCFDDNDDGSGDAIGPRFTGGRLMQINANYIEVRDLNFRYSSRWGLDNNGDNNVFENLLFDANWEFAFDMGGNNNVARYIEGKFTRRGSGIVARQPLNDSLIEWSYGWRNGYEEFCHTGTGQPCKVLPYPGDGAGGGNSDGLAFSKDCHDGQGVGNNICNRNIVRYFVAYKNADDGIDHSSRDTLFYRILSMDNGPEGNRGIKVLRDVYGASQYVDSIVYGNRQASAVGMEHRQDNSATTRSVYLNNLALWNGNRGIQLLKPLLGTLQNNVGSDNGEDIFVLGNCTGGDANCITNWAEDGSAQIPLTGDPQLTNPNLWRSGNEIVFTIPPSEDTIQKRVEWIFNQVQIAFTPAAGSGLIDAGTGTSVQWTNPQTSQTESRPCNGTCDIGPFEFGDPTVRTYPGAEGYGAITQGPRAGNGSYVVRHVTTLNYSGAGSIQAALETDPGGAGVYVVFEVAGYINVPQGVTLQAAYPNTYIAGHTAPGGGVCLRLDPAATTEAVLMAVSASEYIIRGLCFRHGVDPSGTNDAPGLRIGPNVSNIFVDRITNDFAAAEHVDVSANASGDVTNVTIQRSAFINSLEPNSNSMLINDDTGQSQTIIGMSIVRNFFAHSRARVPRVTSRNSAGVEVINNSIYGPNESGGSVYSSLTDIIGNLLLASPGFPSLQWETDPGFNGRPWYNDQAGAPTVPSTYMDGNIVEYKSGNTANDSGGTFAVVRDLATVGQPIPGTWQRGTRLATPAVFPVTITDANTAWATIVTQQNVGAVYRLTETGALVRRPVDTGLEKALIDARDKRPQVDLTRETYVSDPADVGGFPVIATGTPYADVDRDGMADVWETANGLNPADPADAFLTTLQAPYLNIDVFLFGTPSGQTVLRHGIWRTGTLR